LAAAAAGGHVDIADLCFARAAKLNPLVSPFSGRSKDKGWGPLHWAASNGHYEMSIFLVAHGIALLDKAFDGSTAADLAQRHGHDELKAFLKQRENIERELLAPAFNAQPQGLRHNLRITGML
jgi:ankyrin repeat protein